MDIIIKNVTGDPENDGLILELSKAGFPAGSIVYDTVYNRRNKSCSWSSGTDDCIAYLGHTCVEKKKISQIHIFSLREGGMAIKTVVNGKKVAPIEMSKEDVLSFSDKTDRRALAEKYLTSDSESI